VGSDVSHGCIRLRNDVITRLAHELSLGTPVRIATQFRSNADYWSTLSRLGPSQGSASGSRPGCGSLVLVVPVAG
jgi:hypothetical protein